jgi:hypothetical protein
MQIDIGAVALVIVVAIVAILALGLLALGLVRLSNRGRQKFLGHAAPERPYHPVDLLSDADRNDLESHERSTEGDK